MPSDWRTLSSSKSISEDSWSVGSVGEECCVGGLKLYAISSGACEPSVYDQYLHCFGLSPQVGLGVQPSGGVQSVWGVGQFGGALKTSFLLVTVFGFLGRLLLL